MAPPTAPIAAPIRAPSVPPARAPIPAPAAVPANAPVWVLVSQAVMISKGTSSDDSNIFFIQNLLKI